MHYKECKFEAILGLFAWAHCHSLFGAYSMHTCNQAFTLPAPKSNFPTRVPNDSAWKKASGYMYIYDHVKLPQ